MCRPVYHFCPYCQYRRFFMWEECNRFWARYQFTVIDQNNFAMRPRLSRREDEPPACGGPMHEPRHRSWILGRCPRLPHCPSMRIYLQSLQDQQNQQNQQQQQQQQQHKMRRGGGGRHAHMQTRNYFPPPVVCNGTEEEERRREFAVRYFRKIPVQARPRSASVQSTDGADDASYDWTTEEEESSMGSEEEEESNMESEKERSRRQTASAPELFRPPGLRLMPAYEPSESPESTIIESGSEMDSVDWNEQYKTFLAHKLSPAQSV